MTTFKCGKTLHGRTRLHEDGDEQQPETAGRDRVIAGPRGEQQAAGERDDGDQSQRAQHRLAITKTDQRRRDQGGDDQKTTAVSDRNGDHGIDSTQRERLREREAGGNERQQHAERTRRFFAT